MHISVKPTTLTWFGSQEPAIKLPVDVENVLATILMSVDIPPVQLIL
jgi:hypothetical protein